MDLTRSVHRYERIKIVRKRYDRILLKSDGINFHPILISDNVATMYKSGVVLKGVLGDNIRNVQVRRHTVYVAASSGPYTALLSISKKPEFIEITSKLPCDIIDEWCAGKKYFEDIVVFFHGSRVYVTTSLKPMILQYTEFDGIKPSGGTYDMNHIYALIDDIRINVIEINGGKQLRTINLYENFINTVRGPYMWWIPQHQFPPEVISHVQKIDCTGTTISIRRVDHVNGYPMCIVDGKIVTQSAFSMVCTSEGDRLYNCRDDEINIYRCCRWTWRDFHMCDDKKLWVIIMTIVHVLKKYHVPTDVVKMIVEIFVNGD